MTHSLTSGDELNNDPEMLKARIHRQTILLGQQLIEMDDLREDMRKLQRQNRKLRALLTPIN